MPPAIYNDNSSLLFHHAYGFDSQVAYGQFSPVANPLSPIMIDGQLFSPHQVPMSPNFYSQPVSPHVTSSLPTDLSTPANSGQDSLADNMFYGPGSDYYLQYGSYGGANPSGNNNLGFYKYPGEIGSADSASNRSMSSKTGNYASPLTSGALYPAPVGMIGSYNQIFGQIPQQQMAYGYGSVSGSSTKWNLKNKMIMEIHHLKTLFVIQLMIHMIMTLERDLGGILNMILCLVRVFVL